MNTELNSYRGLISLIFPATVAIMLPFLSPVVVGGLVDASGWSEKDAGLLVSTEIGVFAWAALSGLLWLNRIPWKWASLLGSSLLLVANLASLLFHESHTGLQISRAVSGAGSGILIALAYGSLARTTKPHRNYGFFSMSQMSMAIIFLAVLPVMLAGENETGFISNVLHAVGIPTGVGMSAFFAVMLLLSTLSLLLALFWAPLRPTVAAPKLSSDGTIQWLFTGVMLLAIFTLMVSQQGFWTYSERMGVAADLSRSSIGTVLAFGAFCGLLGASSATAIGNNLPRPLVILLIFTIHILGLTCFLLPLNIYLFMLGVFLHKFSWNFMIPYQLGMLAEVEKTGKAAVLSTFITSTGISAGAGFAAFMVEDFGYRGVIYGGMTFAACYTLLMLFLHFSARPVQRLTNKAPDGYRQPGA